MPWSMFSSCLSRAKLPRYALRTCRLSEIKSSDFFIAYFCGIGFSGGSVVKNLPAMQEAQIQALGQVDPLEKEMSTRSSILAWEIPWTEEPGGLQSMGLRKSRTGMSNKQQQTETVGFKY